MRLGQFLLHISRRQGLLSHCSTISENVAVGALDQTCRGGLTAYLPAHNKLFTEASEGCVPASGRQLRSNLRQQLVCIDLDTTEFRHLSGNISATYGQYYGQLGIQPPMRPWS